MTEQTWDREALQREMDAGYHRPNVRIDEHQARHGFGIRWEPGDTLWVGPGTYTRPIFSFHDDDEIAEQYMLNSMGRWWTDQVVCTRCSVGWRWNDSHNCWVCGKPVEVPWVQEPEDT